MSDGENRDVPTGADETDQNAQDTSKPEQDDRKVFSAAEQIALIPFGPEPDAEMDEKQAFGDVATVALRGKFPIEFDLVGNGMVDIESYKDVIKKLEDKEIIVRDEKDKAKIRLSDEGKRLMQKITSEMQGAPQDGVFNKEISL